MSVFMLVHAASEGDVLEITRQLDKRRWFGFGARVDINAFHFQVPNRTISHSLTALTVASKGGHGPAVQLLLERGANVNLGTQKGSTTGITALHYACRNGRLPVVELLLGSGADHNLQDSVTNAQNTPLHYACNDISGGDKNIWVSVVALLLQHGARDTQNKDGETALMLASRGALPIVELLLKSGSDHGIQDTDGNIALHYACSFGQHRIADFLIRNGAMVTCRNKEGKEPLDMCESSATRALLQAAIDTLNECILK